MDVRGLIFDLNGTLIDILTNEGDDDVYRTLSNFLSYQGVLLSAEELKQEFFGRCREQRRSSPEAYPEIDVVAVFRAVLRAHGRHALRLLPAEKRWENVSVALAIQQAAGRCTQGPGDFSETWILDASFEFFYKRNYNLFES